MSADKSDGAKEWKASVINRYVEARRQQLDDEILRAQHLLKIEKCCHSCGIKEIDDVKLLEECDKCDLGRYCNDECKQNHREEHEIICQLRADELRDEILFKQPESSHLGDCPICFLPLPLQACNSMLNTCCGKVICKGCDFANEIREVQQRQKDRCPFCRKQVPKNDEEYNTRLAKRAEANDPAAVRTEGVKSMGKDYEIAFKYLTKAAESGDAIAHFGLSLLYGKGNGVKKDSKMERYHLEEAAIAGHPEARFTLADLDRRAMKYRRVVKHYIIAANLGHDRSIQALKEWYKVGLGVVSKDELAAALRGHQAAVDAMKSPQRDAAEKFNHSHK